MSLAKLLTKRFILPLVAIGPLQPLYKILHRAALAGMNIGPVGEVATSGEARLAGRILGRAPGRAVIFDVGANIGEYTSVCLRAARLPLRIFAFEPSQTIFAQLEKNVRTHLGSSELVLVPQGLSEHPGTANISVVEGFEGNSSLRRRQQDHLSAVSTTEQVELTTIDSFCQENQIDHIYLLKIDIEGEELSCLKGARHMIENGKIGYLQFEFGGCNIQSRVFFRDFWELLTPYYNLYRVLQHSIYPVKYYHELDEVFTTTNFLAVNKNAENC